MARSPPEHFDGWRLDIETVWESYNRIFFSYKQAGRQSENYLSRLYRSHFVVFSYSFIDAVASKILMEKFKVTKSQLKKLDCLRQKVEALGNYKVSVAVLSAYDSFWKEIEWVRNELVHPKRRDHSVAIELDGLDVGNRVSKLNLFAIRAYEIAGMEFPYWLTGWNFVNSMTSESVDQGIVVANNSQFKVFMQECGWRDAQYPFQPLETIENYLMGEKIYERLMLFLGALNFDTQPLPDGIGFSLMPLWSREWWDRNAMERLREFRESQSPWNRTV
jgi:hypothetical protein